jgi:hypothetical protein
MGLYQNIHKQREVSRSVTNNNDDHVDGVWPRLWTAATNGSVVRHPGDIWALRTMLYRSRQRETPVSSARALWQSYKQSSVRKQEERAEIMMDLALRSIFVHTHKRFFTCRKILLHGAFGSAFTTKEDVLRIFIALTNPSPLPGLNPVWCHAR